MRNKILDLAQEINKELEGLENDIIDNKTRIHQLEDYANYLEVQINKEKAKRHKAAQMFREFASWLESED